MDNARGMEPQGWLKWHDGFWGGGNQMRNLAKIGVVVAICFAATIGARAQNRPGPSPQEMERSRPFASVSVPPKPLCLGMVSGRGPTRLKGDVTVHVVANRPFRLGASLERLTQGAGQAVIPPEEMVVTINGKEVTVGTSRVEIASGGPTPASGVDVPIVIEVGMKGPALYPAGQYGGNLALFIR